jgi:hypothetical protein
MDCFLDEICPMGGGKAVQTKLLYCQKCGFITEHAVVLSIADNLEAKLCQQCLLSWSKQKTEGSPLPEEKHRQPKPSNHQA